MVIFSFPRECPAVIWYSQSIASYCCWSIIGSHTTYVNGNACISQCVAFLKLSLWVCANHVTIIYCPILLTFFVFFWLHKFLRNWAQFCCLLHSFLIHPVVVHVQRWCGFKKTYMYVRKVACTCSLLVNSLHVTHTCTHTHTHTHTHTQNYSRQATDPLR